MFKKVALHLNGVLGLRQNDVILASYPRSGNTWVRFFFCNLISLKEWDGRKIDFEVLNKTMPELGVSNLCKPWIHDTIPRIVKTHKKCRFFFKNKRSILIVRDPRDVMVSYYHFKKDKKAQSIEDSFQSFIKNPNYGLRSWFEHYESWREHSSLIVRYEDIRENGIEEFKKMLRVLNLSFREELIRDASKRSNFQNIRKIEGAKKHENKNKLFTRKGSTKQWKDYFDEDSLKYFENLKEEFGMEVY